MMKRKRHLVAGMIFALVLVATSAVSVSAQQPTPPPGAEQPPVDPNPAAAPASVPAIVMRDEPAAANALGTELNAVPANSALWFRFQYDAAGYQAPHPTVTVRLLNGVWNGLSFEIWSPERLEGNWRENKPVGRGTQQLLPSCEEPEGEEGEESVGTAGSSVFVNCGKFETSDLTWTGGFGASGMYYVRLVNSANAPVVPQMLIGGAGMVECVGANFGLPAIGHVPPQDDPFVRVQCMDVGPGLIEGEGIGSQGEEE